MTIIEKFAALGVSITHSIGGGQVNLLSDNSFKTYQGTALNQKEGHLWNPHVMARLMEA